MYSTARFIGFIECEGEKVQCLSCTEVDGAANRISRKSLAGHIKSRAHIDNLALMRRRQKERELHDRRVQTTYEDAQPSGFQSLFHHQPQQRPNMFDEDINTSDVPMEDLFLSTDTPLNLDELVPQLVPPEEAPSSPEEERERLQRQYIQMFYRAMARDMLDPTNDEETEMSEAFLSDELRAAGATDDNEEEDEQESDTEADSDSDGRYAPYPNKTTMLLDVIDNLNRLRLSSAHMKLILWLLKEVGAQNVPSYDAFRKTQSTLQEMCGSKPEMHTSDAGNHFFTNDIREGIARDFANPETAKHLHLYPEETDGPISEVWEAGRWKEYDPSQLTPMFAKGYQHFYIEELAELQDGSFVIPHNWIVRKGVLHSDCSEVTGWQITDNTRSVPASDFAYNYFSILGRTGNTDGLAWSTGSAVPPPKMPNKLRDLVAPDEPLYVVMVPAWMDDVSGNKSKQYNKHLNVYTSNGCLPGRLLQQEFYVRFYSTSPHASTSEQSAAFRDQVNATQTDPIKCFDSRTKGPCRVILRVPGLPADNPQQSEEASHIGGNGNCPCRKCKWGGPTEYRESDAGYDASHYSGTLRDAAEIKENLRKQLKQAMYGFAKPVQLLQTATGTKDKITQEWIDVLIAKAKEMQAKDPKSSPEEIATLLEKWLDEQPGDKMNPLLDIAGLDPSQDTPVEILHTILLGIVKYVWHLLNTQQWSEADRALFAIRLQSTDIGGLTIPPIRASYMVQYKNNLIGKHFKTLMQTTVFHAHDITTPAQFTLIKAVSQLGALLWVPKIINMTEYLSDLKIVIGNVLDAFGDIQPSRILDKIKIHLLPHLLQDIPRFGPAIRYSTEVYEGFNPIFRLCSIYSNHQAPSRDISTKFSQMERLKHILCGGFYWLKDEKRWTQAGDNVLKLLRQTPVLQRHLGWVPQREINPGYIRPKSKKKSPPIEWKITRASRALAEHGTASANPICAPSGQSLWRLGVSVTTSSGDQGNEGSWVVARNLTGALVIGRIAELLTRSEDSEGEFDERLSDLATLEVFICGDTPHPDFEYPILRRPTGEEITTQSAHSYVVVRAEDVQFVFNAQHDCRFSQCKATGFEFERQERQTTTRTTATIAHVDDDHFVLREVLPRYLTQPRPLYADRRQHHNELAIQLRSTQSDKRQRTREKAAETRARNKAKRDANRLPTIDEIEEGNGPESEDEPEEEEEEEAPASSNSRKRRRVSKK
ncbi:hypothetical protein BDZ89DRAFT_1096970 [Hymenopellis radicata]|nr:hypothetical protein BDZ89DRAFT_1096970 [Hymenopellis radicata]